MKPIAILALLIVFSMADTFAQTLRELPKPAYELYPTLRDMYGYAVGQYQQYLIIFGGSIRSDAPGGYQGDFPNLDILLIDLALKRASAYTSSNLEGELAEQACSTGMAYCQKGQALYLLGGYGYSESQGQHMTFPYLAVIDLGIAVEALMAGKPVHAGIYQLCDERLAIFDGLMDENEDIFFLINGRYAYKLEPFSRQPQYFEESLEGQARTFKLPGKGNTLQISDFQAWYDLEGFQGHYGPLLPEAIEREVQKLLKTPEQ